MSTSEPLFPPTALLPQSDPGGVRQIPARQPGPLRPFAATLAVPLQIDAKKHDTIATKSSQKTPEITINDGTSSDDSVTDTDVDD